MLRWLLTRFMRKAEYFMMRPALVRVEVYQRNRKYR